MRKNERQQRIVELLKNYGTLDVASLCRMFQVSAITIRRDLYELQEQNLIVRSHGGAILPPDNGASERAYELRLARRIPEKKAIAREALKLIQDGNRVFFDSSTTVYALAKMIESSQHFSVVTDTLPTAMELNYREHVQVICLGGELKKSTGSCVGMFAEQVLSCMYFDTAFIGLPSISPEGIMTVSSDTELEIKKMVISRSDQLVILADSSKLRRPDFFMLGDIEQADILITDSGMPESFMKLCRDRGTKVIVASCESAE